MLIGDQRRGRAARDVPVDVIAGATDDILAVDHSSGDVLGNNGVGQKQIAGSHANGKGGELQGDRTNLHGGTSVG